MAQIVQKQKEGVGDVIREFYFFLVCQRSFNQLDWFVPSNLLMAQKLAVTCVQYVRSSKRAKSQIFKTPACKQLAEGKHGSKTIWETWLITNITKFFIQYFIQQFFSDLLLSDQQVNVSVNCFFTVKLFQEFEPVTYITVVSNTEKPPSQWKII